MRRNWRWQVHRLDGSLVGVFNGQAHAKRDLMPDSFHVLIATGVGLCYRMILYRDDRIDATYIMRRLRDGDRPTPPCDWIMGIHHDRPHQRKRRA